MDFGRVVGGMLSGFGGALHEQGKAEREHANKLIEMEYGANLRDRSSTMQHGFAMDERGFSADRDDARQNRADTNAEKRADRQHGYRLDEIDAQGRNTRSNAAFADSLDDGDIAHWSVDDSGEVVGFTKDGTQKKTGSKSGKADVLNPQEKTKFEAIKGNYTKKTKISGDDGDETTETFDAPRFARENPGLAKKMGLGDLAKPAPKATLPQGVSAADALAQGKAAIAAGKDRGAVIKRLQSYGINTSGL